MTKVEKDLIKTVDEVREFILEKTNKLSTEELRVVLNNVKDELVIKEQLYMMKIQIKYENESDKKMLIDGLSKEFKVVKVSNPYKNGRYYRVYVDIE